MAMPVPHTGTVSLPSAMSPSGVRCQRAGEAEGQHWGWQAAAVPPCPRPAELLVPRTSFFLTVKNPHLISKSFFSTRAP